MDPSSSDEITVLAPPGAGSSEPSPGEKRVGHLIVLSGSSVGRVFALQTENTVLGREDAATIQLMDPGVSRRHAEIKRSASGEHRLCDLGSRNGTYANNQRLTAEHPLRDGDRVQLGLISILKFTLNDNFEAHYAQRMYDAALRDGLTGAFNRRYFDQRLLSEFSFARRHGSSLSLIMIDLDHFKQLNDTRGHLAGDSVLRQLCERVSDVVRAEDVVVRYGGEEFALLCRDTGLKEASMLAERVRHAIADASFPLEDDNQASVTISAGVVAVPDREIDSPEALVSAADSALYEAKRQGRNCVVTRRPSR